MGEVSDGCYEGIIVEIEKAETGEVRTWKSDMSWSDGSEFYWTDGNFGCDCNRALVFHWAGGGDGEPDHDCGDDAFRIVSIKAKNGQLLFSEPAC